MVGQAHGHNWLPNNGEICANCLKLETCASSSVFASLDDRVWTSAVHSREPFALCEIFGRTARGDLVHKMYGLLDGRLQERPFHLVPDFQPIPYTSK